MLLWARLLAERDAIPNPMMEGVGTVTNVATEILAQTEARLLADSLGLHSSGHPQLAEEMEGGPRSKEGNESSLWAQSASCSGPFIKDVQTEGGRSKSRHSRSSEFNSMDQSQMRT